MVAVAGLGEKVLGEQFLRFARGYAGEMGKIVYVVSTDDVHPACEHLHREPRIEHAGARCSRQ